MEVEHVVTLSEMGPLITEITEQADSVKLPVPEDVLNESRIAEKTASAIDDVSKLGTQSLYNCPDCGGGLYGI